MRFRILLGLVSLAANPAMAQNAFDPQARVTEALEQVRPIAYHRATLDWTDIETRARTLAADARDEIDLLPAYQAVVWYLEDNHSFIQPSEALRAGWAERYGQRRLIPDSPRRATSTSQFVSRTEVESRLLTLPSGRVAVAVTVPAVNWIEGELSAPYGNTLYQTVAAAADDACGFVIDIRGNRGGDMWPMVTGLSDLIGDGYRFAVAGPDGTLNSTAYLREGGAFSDPVDPQEPLINQVSNWRPRPHLAQIAVAVLTDDGTASSGEIVALAFRGRPATRSFGQKTYGIASSNEMIVLSDGMRMFITVAFATDRDGKVYPSGIPADQLVEAGPGDATDPDDAVVEQAKAWLATQDSCTS